MNAPHSVLVVDNDPAILKFSSVFLTRKGYRVEVAEDGLSALRVLDRYVPDVIFIDLVMPNIGGDKLCSIIRSMDRFKDTYLVLLSAISAEEHARYLQYGFNACIAKGPLRATGEHLLTLLHRLESESSRSPEPIELGINGLAKREITRELLSTKNHYELVLGNMAEGILEITQDARVIYANPSATALVGVPETSLLGTSFLALFADRSLQRVEQCLAAAAQGPQSIGQDDPVAIGLRRLSVYLLPVSDGLSSSLTVILNDVTDRYGALMQLRQAHKELERRVDERTAELSQMNARLATEVGERKRAEETIRASLEEKELLLREIHHRVKNNLQIVSSLLRLPLRRAGGGSLADIVQETQNRIRSIWLIHEKLYRSESLSMVDFGQYVHTLAVHLFDSYCVDRSKIALDVECEAVQFDVDTAIPCGLILNEVVSNALSHAFPGTGTGRITIRLQQLADGRCRLAISDDGVGIPAGVDASGERTLGMRIVDSLAKQIDGVARFETSGGTTFTLVVPAVRKTRSRPPVAGHK